jgi:GNAT superfamily N-acetyltransferase
MEFGRMTVDETIMVAKLYNELAYFTQRETKDAYWDFGTLSAEPLSNNLKNIVEHPERRIFVARENNECVGFIAGEISQCHLPLSSTKKIGFISGAFVLPDYRGKGIMKTLEGRMVDFFRESGVKYSELFFIANNEVGRKCWNSLGYQTFREQARKPI